mmetsp:Transcript_2749/g.5328  ORF Transcript_2749/g.5328 Transcript_2749/m.5328 type:complete len:348 (-) Transcript_2749:43-1086(-)
MAPASSPEARATAAAASLTDTNRILFTVDWGIAFEAIRQRKLNAPGASTMKPVRKRPRKACFRISAAATVGRGSRFFASWNPRQSHTTSKPTTPFLVASCTAASRTTAMCSALWVLFIRAGWCRMDIRITGCPPSPRATSRMSPCHLGSCSPRRSARCSCRQHNATASSLADSEWLPLAARLYMATTCGVHQLSSQASRPPGTCLPAAWTIWAICLSAAALPSRSASDDTERPPLPLRPRRIGASASLWELSLPSGSELEGSGNSESPHGSCCTSSIGCFSFSGTTSWACNAASRLTLRSCSKSASPAGAHPHPHPLQQTWSMIGAAYSGLCHQNRERRSRLLLLIG